MSEQATYEDVVKLGRAIVDTCNEGEGVNEITLTAALGQVITSYVVSRCDGDIAKAEKYASHVVKNLESYISTVAIAQLKHVDEDEVGN